tara:strand:+ start:9446 stop:9649 length:204 start_codon:yes stop_codon:yes gene_type:complete
MQTEAVALIITAIFGGIASIIYSLKHIRKSECCGNRCIQQVDGEVPISVSPISPIGSRTTSQLVSEV